MLSHGPEKGATSDIVLLISDVVFHYEGPVDEIQRA
jgi:hypothetical protein